MPPREISVALLAGPQFIGFMFNWGLLGVLSLQSFIYYLWFPKDKRFMKALVYGLLAFEWVQTGLVTQSGFEAFVYGFGDVGGLTQYHNTWFSITIMCPLVSGVTQTFFAWRIWTLGRSKILAAAVLFLAVAQTAVGVAGGILLHVVNPTAAEFSVVTPIISTWLASAAAVDIIIALAMTILLMRGKNGIKRSDDIINSLVRLTIESGTVTAVVAIADVVCFTAFSDTPIHECPALILSKIYANTLVASLNNRAVMTLSHPRQGGTRSSNSRRTDVILDTDPTAGNSYSLASMAFKTRQDGLESTDTASATLRSEPGGKLRTVEESVSKFGEVSAQNEATFV